MTSPPGLDPAQREAGEWIISRLSGYPKPHDPTRLRCRCVTVTPKPDDSYGGEWWDRCPRPATAEDGICGPCRDPEQRFGEDERGVQYHAWLIPLASLGQADEVMA